MIWKNCSHEMLGTRWMFERIGRDVDTEMALAKPTIYECPKKFPDPRTGELVPWYIDQREDGVIVQVLKDLLKMRKAVRAKQANTPYGSYAYKSYEGKQLACKLVANSTYGATGVTEGRIACIQIGSTVTGAGKVTIQNVDARLRRRYPHLKAGTACMGGDTDSVFERLGHLQTIYDIGQWIAEAEDFCNSLLSDPMKIEFEKAFLTYLALAKKRYAFDNYGAKGFYFTPFNEADEAFCESLNAHARSLGDPEPYVIEEQRGKLWKRYRMDVEGTLKSKGMETVRRDSCEIVRTTLGTVLELVVAKRAPDLALEHAREVARDLVEGRVPLHELVMSKHYSKLAYASQSLPHLTIIRKCRERGLPEPELGSRIAFLIVKGAKGSKAFERAELVEYVLEHALEVDYEYYLENQFVKPMLRVLDWILGFRRVPAPRKKYKLEKMLKMLRVERTTRDQRTIGSVLGGASANEAPTMASVVELPNTMSARCVAAAHDWVHLGALDAHPTQHHFRPRLSHESRERCSCTLLAIPLSTATAASGGTKMAPIFVASAAPKCPRENEARALPVIEEKRLWRENGYDYISLAHERVFGSLTQRRTVASTRSLSEASPMHGFVRAERACAVKGCLNVTCDDVCASCCAEQAGARAREALDAIVSEAREQHEATLPKCRTCSGNFDLESEIDCANSDCGYFYPRRETEHELRRTRKRRSDLDVHLEQRAAGTAKRMRALSSASDDAMDV